MEIIYPPAIALFKSIFAVMDWDVQVIDEHHIPKAGPAVLASNHISYLDFIVVGHGPRNRGRRLVRFATKKEVFDHWLIGPLMRDMKHLPVDREKNPSAVLDEAKLRLAKGQLVGMFPEGTISRSLMPSKARTGTARMAMSAGAPLIPVGVWGDHRIWTKGRDKTFNQRHIEIRVVYGPPVPYDPDEDPRVVTDRLMAAITTLVSGLQESYTQKPKNEEDRWWLPARLGGTAPTPEEAERIIEEERAERRRKRELER